MAEIGEHILIGMVGKARSGKDTVADYLCQKYNFVKIGWADPLKQIVGKQLFYLTDDQIYGDSKDLPDVRWGMTPRKILQKVGTDLFRDHFDKEFWVKRGMYRIAEIRSQFPRDSRIVITDCRFINELKAVESLNGYTIRTIRQDAKPRLNEHSSETALERQPTSFEIRADTGRLEDIYSQVELIMGTLNVR